MTDEPITGYIDLKVRNSECIKEVRDEVYFQSGAHIEGYCIKEPHITIIPPFSIPRSQAQAVEELVSSSQLIGEEVIFTGMGVWPSIRNPRVVLLTTSLSLREERERLMTNLARLGASFNTRPVKPHLTLFKIDNGFEVETAVKHRLRQCIFEQRGFWSDTVEFVDFTRT